MNVPIEERTNYVVRNNQGLNMKCIKYINANDIVVEFENPYYQTKNWWGNFIKGEIKNPMVSTVYGVGITGDKYKTNKTSSTAHIKEYQCWLDLLFRVYGNKKDKGTYVDCKVCEEWLYYPNFYEWLHNQENFEKWEIGIKWCLDKDIICKGNKNYSSETCCLVPNNVNTLFVKKIKIEAIYLLVLAVIIINIWLQLAIRL